MNEHTVLTPWGRVRLPLLRGSAGKTESLIHETRTVYVITEGTKPTMDLNWLTDTGRVVTPEEFVLIRRSDARSSLPELKKSVLTNKWALLQNGVSRGWFGILALAGLIIGIAASLSVLTVGSGSLIIPLPGFKVLAKGNCWSCGGISWTLRKTGLQQSATRCSARSCIVWPRCKSA